MDQVLLTRAVLVAAFTGAAMVLDLRTRRLPNWLTVSGLTTGLGFHLVTEGWPGLQQSLSGLAIGLGALLVLWLLGGGGGGDVKLMGAVGAWLGPALTVIVLVLSGMLTVLGHLGLLVAGRVQSPAERVDGGAEPPDGRRPATASAAASPEDVGRSPAEATTSGVNRPKVPYAFPVALATWTVLLLKLWAAHARATAP